MDLKIEKIINVRKDGNIYKGLYKGRSVIIKESLSCNPCLNYEYIIGTEINKIREILPFFAHTYDIIIDPERTLLIVEYIKGKPICDIPTTLNERIILLNMIFCVLYRAQEINGFNHNDLHMGNILFYPLGTYKQFDFMIHGTPYSFISKWSFSLIDFGMASVKNMEEFISPGTLWGGGLNRVNLGIVPSVFDPLGDFIVIMLRFPLNNYFDRLIDEMTRIGQRKGKLSNNSGYMELLPCMIINQLISTENRSPIYYVYDGISREEALIHLNTIFRDQREDRNMTLQELTKRGYNLNDLEGAIESYRDNEHPPGGVLEEIKEFFTRFAKMIYPLLYHLKFYIVKHYTLTPLDIIKSFHHHSLKFISYKGMK